MNKRRKVTRSATKKTKRKITAGQKKIKKSRNYKDTVFRMLFKDKENLLSLYNAVNGTAYTEVDNLEITTLENAIYEL